MRRIVLSSAARADRKEITTYTVARFGIAQARRLRDRFAATLGRLADAPHLGRSREDSTRPAVPSATSP